MSSNNGDKRRYFITYLINTKDGRTIFSNGIVEIPKVSEVAMHDMIMNLFAKNDAKGVTILFMIRLEKDDVYEPRNVPTSSTGSSEKN
jgi:hypothetical protein